MSWPETLWLSVGEKRHRQATVLMLEFVILHLCLFHTVRRQFKQSLATTSDNGSCFSEQSSDNQELTSSPYRRLLRLKTMANVSYKLGVGFMTIELFRYTLIELLKTDALRDYQLLDCFLLGRFRFIGRLNAIGSRLMIVFAFTFWVYRIYFYRLLPPFRFPAFEFLLHDYGEVVLHEHECHQRGFLRRSIISAIEKEEKRGSSSRFMRHRNSSKGPDLSNIAHKDWRQSSSGSYPLPAALYLESPSKPMRSGLRRRRVPRHSSGWILRPNRTAECWRTLANFTEFMLLATVASVFSWICLMTMTIGGSIMTELGFEFSYTACTSWLQQRQLTTQAQGQASGMPYSSIYVAPRVLAHQMNIDDLPAVIPLDKFGSKAPNLYQLARIYFDIFENCWVYIDFILIASCVNYTIFISSLDVYLNAREIKPRLNKVIVKLVRMHAARGLARNSLAKIDENDSEWDDCYGRYELMSSQTTARGRLTSKGAVGRRRSEQDELTQEILDVQSVLADHFDLVRGYNHFMTWLVQLVLFTWASASMLICFWMGSAKSKSLEFDFLVTEVGAGTFMIGFFSGAAVTRSLNYRLYGPITRAMALDDDCTVTKLRWATLMKYYTPKSLYCFTFLESTEISWFFCVQFVGYVVSAYTVLKQYFFYRH